MAARPNQALRYLGRDPSSVPQGQHSNIIYRALPNGAILRICNVCHSWLPLEQFYAQSSSIGGYRDPCKACYKSQRQHL